MLLVRELSCVWRLLDRRQIADFAASTHAASNSGISGRFKKVENEISEGGERKMENKDLRVFNFPHSPAANEGDRRERT